MSSNCKNTNPLMRSGVNQYQRVLNALLPDFASADERNDADLILFAKNFSKHLLYYNSTNPKRDTLITNDTNWKPFMSSDVSVTLAAIVKTRVQKCFTFLKEIFDKTADTNSEAEAKNYFKGLFDFGFSVIVLLDNFYTSLPDGFEFKDVIKSIIKSNLPEYSLRLQKYYAVAPGENLIDTSSTDTSLFEDCPIPYILSQNFKSDKLNEIWKEIPAPDFTPTFNGFNVLYKIKNTCTHNLFTGIFNTLLESLASIVDKAPAYLEKTFNDFPSHTPHYALYLTFIKLFRYAQDHLNEFTKNHLDLYYKEILQLKTLAAEPDEVHLIFQLQKNITEHQVAKDTVFKAGKDSDSKEIFYALKEDIVVNEGNVKSIKNIFVKKSSASKQIFAKAIANSEDGLGAELESTDGSWNTFGEASSSSSAETGFAVASNYLYLKEGERTITFRFYSVDRTIGISVNDINNLFSLELTGEKGWIPVTINSEDVSIPAIDATDPNAYFQIQVTLDGGKDAVVPYSESVHLKNFKTELPVAKFLIKDSNAADAVWNFNLSKLEIDIAVTGLKDVTIQNDAGTLSTSKPFEMFGSSPVTNSSFIIGSKELFLKALSPNGGDFSGYIQITWDNYDDLKAKQSDNKGGVLVKNHTINITYLKKSIWLPQTPVTKNLFNVSDVLAQSSIDFTIPELTFEPDYSDNDFYSVKSKWGFLKLSLNQEFGHRTYAEELTESILKYVGEVITYDPTDTGKDSFGERVPDYGYFGYYDSKAASYPSYNATAEPYTPKVKEISIDYSVTTDTDFSSDEKTEFFHITPFGNKSVFKSGNETSISFLPAFNNEGELFIGIENIKEDQTISILFQIAEGSANPLASSQELDWFYLGNDNNWIEFENENIADGTDDLANSGIIKFSILSDASAANTLMTDHIIWLRATVLEKTDAVCKLITVTAQAATAVFFDYNKTENYFKNTLSSNSISKFVVSDSAVKKVSQPYASFGGRVKESDDKFYTRASERLRHKNRSITMWDYERMVLEEFPEIYKVKCINHTQIIETAVSGSTEYTDNERKPGYVLVVPIPDLQNKNAFDPLRPNTSLGLLTDIQKYLYNYISPHVNLDVRNPRFEEIQLDLNVKFTTDDNEFYEKKLKEELEQYMAPWAYDPATDIEFGGKISKSALIDFIEERTYVDYVSCVKMNRIVDGDTTYNIEEAIATSSRSVFVSVKSDGTNAHIINPENSQCEC